MSLIARLIAAGTPPELVEEVAMLVAEKRLAEQAIERRRVSDKERQTRRRNVMSRDVTLDTVTDRDVTGAPALSLPPNEINSNPSTHTHPEGTTRACKPHRLPSDWAVPILLPEPLASSIAAWPSGAIERELAKFKDWAKSAPGKTGLKSDWDATWRNWLRRREDEGTYRNGRSDPNIRASNVTSHDRRSSLARAIDEGLDYLGRP